MGHDVEQRPDPQSLGPLGQHGAEQHGIGDYFISLVLEVMLGQPEDVEATLFGHHPHIKHPLRADHICFWL